MPYKRPKTLFYVNLLIPIVYTMVLMGCGGNKLATSSKTKTESNKTPKIVFINYTIKKNGNGEQTINFVSAKKVDGKLKNQKKKISDYGDFNDLICAQFDASSSILSQQLIKNPLSQHIEYVDETKKFKIAKIELDSAAFTVRLQLYPETKFIAINYSNKERPLILTKVSEL